MKELCHYIKLLKEPSNTWHKLAQNANYQSIRTAYLIMLLIVPFSIIGNLIDIAYLDWNILISNALATFVALFISLHIATSFYKIYYEKITNQNIPYIDCLQYIAYASAAVYATVWLVELTQMPTFWLCSFYTLKIVLESVQAKFVVVEEDKKLTFVWIVSIILIASPFLMQYILGLMIKG